jgi:SAM-dependent methyltransferase
VLALGSGGQRAELIGRLGGSQDVDLVAVDVDRNADVDAWCDAHALPFADDQFDGLITTAVLEHVLQPERVAAEIARVVKPGGLLYSEIPFIQQVHEGAYDFTRYTLSGHRRLFDAFEEIESGPVAGPATALVWSIEHLALALVDRPRMRAPVKACVRLLFGWIRLLDRRLAERPAAVDGASCTYFLGARRTEGRASGESIVARYRGAQRVRHI